MDQMTMFPCDAQGLSADALIADQRIRQASLDFASALRAAVHMHEDVEVSE